MSAALADPAEVVQRAALSALSPPAPIPVWQWAAEHMEITRGSDPGPYDPMRTPYVIEPMECLSVTSPIETVVLIWGSQLGKSTCGLAWTGYVIENSPGPLLAVRPRTLDAKKYVQTRLDPMISGSPVLRGIVSSKDDREGANTMSTKTFAGGLILVTPASKAAGMKSDAIRYLDLDEIDEFPADVDDQGDPIALSVRRTNTFGHRRKILMTSTPTVKGRSRIAKAYTASDQRQFHVPCPLCGEFQVLEFERIRWKKDRPETAHYVCASCEKPFEESTKREFLPAGRWIAEAEGGRVAGFHLPSWYSPYGWLSWADIASDWLEAHEDPTQLKVFVNTVMAETFEDRGEAPAWQRLYDRREDLLEDEIPEGCVFLTAGVDVQKNRLEAFVWGWGADRESWLISHRVIAGSPYNPETFDGLDELLAEVWDYGDGAGDGMALRVMAVDTGFAQAEVVAWARVHGRDPRVMLVKGDHWKNWKVMVGSPTAVDVQVDGKRVGVKLWSVGGALIKQETYGFFNLDAPLDGEEHPPGWIHLGKWVDDELCKGLVSEDLVESEDRRGYPVRVWKKNRRENEPLDGRVYARAAAERAGLSRLRKEAAESEPKRPKKSKSKSKGSDWLGRGSRRGSGGGWL